MAFVIFLLFLTVPIIEIAVFIQVGGWIGLWPTIGVVILTAVIGTAMLRQQGLSVLFRIQENLEAQRVPVRELFDGICLVIAGALLLTPGFVTDAVGFALFVPPFRAWIGAWLAARFLARADVHVHRTGYGPRHGPASGAWKDSRGTVIDGEYEDVTGTDADDENPPEKRLPGRRED